MTKNKDKSFITVTSQVPAPEEWSRGSCVRISVSSWLGRVDLCILGRTVGSFFLWIVSRQLSNIMCKLSCVLVGPCHLWSSQEIFAHCQGECPVIILSFLISDVRRESTFKYLHLEKYSQTLEADSRSEESLERKLQVNTDRNGNQSLRQDHGSRKQFSEFGV